MLVKATGIAVSSDPPSAGLAGFLQAPTRFLFFTGKGGVGKTTVAAAIGKFSKRTVIVPWVADEPVGSEKLGQLFKPNPSSDKSPEPAPEYCRKSMYHRLQFWSGERTRLGCWLRRLAEASDALGGTPRAACETPALPGPLLRSNCVPKPVRAPGYRTHCE